VTVEVVLATQVRLTVWDAACTPLPVNEIVVGEPVALLVTKILPLALPAVTGSKITLNVRFCDGLSVTGAPAPLSEYTAVPLTAICEICTLELPVFAMVSLCVADVPVFTLPKPIFVELKERVSVCATPVPLRATEAGEFGALLKILTVPVRLPAVVGANTALKVTLLLGATVLGTLRPPTE
jgi:hypothetical protein